MRLRQPVLCWAVLLVLACVVHRRGGVDRIACVTSVMVGSSVHAGSVLQSPWAVDRSFYFVSNGSTLQTVRERGWTGVLLNVSDIPFDAGGGPTEMPELGWTASDADNMRAKYVKILSHRIPELASCDVVLYMDSKVYYDPAVAYGLLSAEHECATLFIHPWRSVSSGYAEEVEDSLRAARYARFKPALDLQLARHGWPAGRMYLGSTHVFNLRNPEARRLQDGWWRETVAYSIQDQLSQFWQVQEHSGCVRSLDAVYGELPPPWTRVWRGLSRWWSKL